MHWGLHLDDRRLGIESQRPLGRLVLMVDTKETRGDGSMRLDLNVTSGHDKHAFVYMIKQ